MIPIDPDNINFFEQAFFVDKKERCSLSSTDLKRASPSVETSQRRSVNLKRDSIHNVSTGKTLLEKFQDICDDDNAIEVFTFAASQDGAETNNAKGGQQERPLSVVFQFPSLFKNSLLQKGLFLNQPKYGNDIDSPQFIYDVVADNATGGVCIKQSAKFELFDAGSPTYKSTSAQEKPSTWCGSFCAFFCCYPDKENPESVNSSKPVSVSEANKSMEVNFYYKLTQQNGVWTFEPMGVEVPEENAIKVELNALRYPTHTQQATDDDFSRKSMVVAV